MTIPTNQCSESLFSSFGNPFYARMQGWSLNAHYRASNHWGCWRFEAAKCRSLLGSKGGWDAGLPHVKGQAQARQQSVPCLHKVGQTGNSASSTLDLWSEKQNCKQRLLRVNERWVSVGQLATDEQTRVVLVQITIHILLWCRSPYSAA